MNKIMAVISMFCMAEGIIQGMYNPGAFPIQKGFPAQRMLCPWYVVPHAHIMVPPTRWIPRGLQEGNSRGLQDTKAKPGGPAEDMVIWARPDSGKLFADSCVALYASLGKEQAAKELKRWRRFISPRFKCLAQQMRKQDIMPLLFARKMRWYPIT